MDSTDKWVIGIIVAVLLVAALGIGIAYGLNTTKDQALTEYAESDVEKPAIGFDKFEYDFGNLTPTSVESVVFVAANLGQKPLKISDFKTSCGCTTVVVTINGEKSSKFSMHTNSSWIGEIEPGGEAQIEVTYDATVHPAEGDVTRYIYFNTNDPKNPKSELSIKLNVQ